MDVSWRRDVDIFQWQPGTSEPLFLASPSDIANSPVFTTAEWVEVTEGRTGGPFSSEVLRVEEEALQAQGYVRCVTPDGEMAWLLVLNFDWPNPQTRWSM
jgi:hypothetical protein